MVPPLGEGRNRLRLPLLSDLHGAKLFIEEYLERVSAHSPRIA